MKIHPLLCCLFATALAAQEIRPNSRPATPAPTPRPTQTPSLRGKLIYKPVGRGAPAGRVDAGSRGDGDDVASLYVLAPEEIGQTTRAQPSLYWFQSRPAQVPFEFSLLKPNDPRPVLRLRRANAAAAGFQSIDLAAHGVNLAPDTDYQWVVALIRDPESRSRDIVSSGWIRRVSTPKGTERGASAATLAANSLWYDAVAALFAQIAARPQDDTLRRDRDDLLAQVGLGKMTNGK